MRAASTVSYHSAILSNWPVRNTKWANLAGRIACETGASRRTGAISFIGFLPWRNLDGTQPTPVAALPRDGVVTGAGEFDQIEAGAERVRHVRHAAVFALLNDAVEAGALRQGASP